MSAQASERTTAERALERVVLAFLKLLNPFMTWALASPAHPFFSRWFVLLQFRGRRSGRVIRTPASYFRERDAIVLTTKRAWWRNLEATRPVDCWLRGHRVQWAAVVVQGERDVEAALARAPTWFLTLAALDDGRLTRLRGADLRRSVGEGRVVLRLGPRTSEAKDAGRLAGT